MNILPVMPNYTMAQRNRVVSKQPTFRGELNNFQANRLLKILAGCNTEVFENFNLAKLDAVAQPLVEKYSAKGVRSIAAQVVSNEDLKILLGADISKYDTKGKIGLCIAVGDKNGPIETMKKIYEAKTLLINPEALRR